MTPKASAGKQAEGQMRVAQGEARGASGEVAAIYIAPAKGAAMVSLTEARAVPGQGIEGDRYFKGSGTYSGRRDQHDDLTLIELEVIEALGKELGVALGPGDARRNVVTKGIALNEMIGREFRIGDVRLKGLRLCEPCLHLESLTKPGVLDGLVHRGGLRAAILTEGTIRVGDRLEERE